jgi:hypothetical protein
VFRLLVIEQAIIKFINNKTEVVESVGIDEVKPIFDSTVKEFNDIHGIKF